MKTHRDLLSGISFLSDVPSLKSSLTSELAIFTSQVPSLRASLTSEFASLASNIPSIASNVLQIPQNLTLGTKNWCVGYQGHVNCQRLPIDITALFPASLPLSHLLVDGLKAVTSDFIYRVSVANITLNCLIIVLLILGVFLLNRTMYTRLFISLILIFGLITAVVSFLAYFKAHTLQSLSFPGTKISYGEVEKITLGILVCSILIAVFALAALILTYLNLRSTEQAPSDNRDHRERNQSGTRSDDHAREILDAPVVSTSPKAWGPFPSTPPYEIHESIMHFTEVRIHKDIWKMIFKDEKWLKMVSRYCNPFLVGADLHLLSNNRKSPAYLALLLRDHSRASFAFKADFKASLRSHEVNEEGEFVFQNSNIILHVMDVIDPQENVPIKAEKLFHSTPCLHTASLFWKFKRADKISKKSIYEIKTIQGGDIVGTVKEPKTLDDISMACGINIYYPPGTHKEMGNERRKYQLNCVNPQSSEQERTNASRFWASFQENNPLEAAFV